MGQTSHRWDIQVHHFKLQKKTSMQVERKLEVSKKNGGDDGHLCP